MGLRALKTDMCSRTTTRKPGCPVCCKWIRMIDDVARPLSVTHSKVRCCGSNELVSESNQAVVFPDHRVYGLRHVRKVMARNGGKFVGLSQTEAFDPSQMRRVFFL